MVVSNRRHPSQREQERLRRRDRLMDAGGTTDSVVGRKQSDPPTNVCVKVKLLSPRPPYTYIPPTEQVASNHEERRRKKNTSDNKNNPRRASW